MKFFEIAEADRTISGESGLLLVLRRQPGLGQLPLRILTDVAGRAKNSVAKAFVNRWEHFDYRSLTGRIGFQADDEAYAECRLHGVIILRFQCVRRAGSHFQRLLRHLTRAGASRRR